jgi:hypothetical protein
MVPFEGGSLLYLQLSEITGSVNDAPDLAGPLHFESIREKIVAGVAGSYRRPRRAMHNVDGCKSGSCPRKTENRSKYGHLADSAPGFEIEAGVK